MCESEWNRSHNQGLSFRLIKPHVIFFYYSVKQASFYPDPLALYSYIFSKGVGTRTAALYVAWAQQLEQRGLNEQADALYQKAMENQAQPADTIADELR